MSKHYKSNRGPSARTQLSLANSRRHACYLVTKHGMKAPGATLPRMSSCHMSPRVSQRVAFCLRCNEWSHVTHLSTDGLVVLYYYSVVITVMPRPNQMCGQRQLLASVVGGIVCNSSRPPRLLRSCRRRRRACRAWSRGDTISPLPIPPGIDARAGSWL